MLLTSIIKIFAKDGKKRKTKKVKRKTPNVSNSARKGKPRWTDWEKKNRKKTEVAAILAVC